ncbi:hypothetical protein CBL_00641 [Carabus blaptoides fortunei]
MTKFWPHYHVSRENKERMCRVHKFSGKFRQFDVHRVGQPMSETTTHQCCLTDPTKHYQPIVHMHAYKASEFASNCSCATLGGLFARRALGLASHRNLITPGRHRHRRRRHQYQYQYARAFLDIVYYLQNKWVILSASLSGSPPRYLLPLLKAINMRRVKCRIGKRSFSN